MYTFVLQSLVTLSFLHHNVFAFKFLANPTNESEAAFHQVLRRTHSHLKRHADGEMAHMLKERQGGLDIFAQLSEALSGSSGVPSLPLGGSFIGPEWDVGPTFWEDHQWLAPGDDDQRGPCVGLNALANQRIIDHTGIVGFFEAFTALTKVIGFGADLALILCIMGVVWGGNPLQLKFSIGGPDPRIKAPLDGVLGLFGTPQGIDFTHNFVETDSSLTRRDLFETGNCWNLDIQLFSDLYYSVPFGQGFTFENRAAWASRRFYQSIATNPEFYAGPYSLFLARNSAWIFAVRVLADWSTGSPVLTHDMLLSWYGVFETPNGLVANQGWERIPSNWKRIPRAYDLIALNIDLVQWAIWYPELASVGGNTGTVNSFVGIDLSNPSSAIEGVPNLLLNNHLICFALEMVKNYSPTFTNNLFTTLFGIFGATVESLRCPQVGVLTVGGVPIEDWAKQQFPGARKGGWT